MTVQALLINCCV